MLKQYSAKVRVLGHYTVEDPKCPPDWRGSGCYDIDVKTWAEQNVDVWARSEDEARKYIEDYDYAQDTTIDVDKVEIKSIAFVEVLDRDETESGVVDINVNWKE